MQDFGLRALDTATGQLKSIVWLSDYVGKSADPKPRKQLLLLNFFAVWCKPCIAELPVLARLQSSYGPRGLQILSINFRAEGESVERAIAGTRKLWAAEPPNFPVLFDRYTNRNQLLYMGGRASLPCNLLFDRDGRLLERFQGGDAEQLQKLEQRVAALLDSDRRAATELQP
jgi:thiol-disulfide isomerase/thioredoxin